MEKLLTGSILCVKYFICLPYARNNECYPYRKFKPWLTFNVSSFYAVGC